MRRIHSYKKMKLHDGGFTLIELAVVVTIIAFMMAAFISVGFVLKGRSDRQKTKAVIAVLETAIEEFYSVRNQYPRQVVECDDDTVPVDKNPYAADQVAFYEDTDAPENVTYSVRSNCAFLRWQLSKISSVRGILDKIPGDNIPEIDPDLGTDSPAEAEVKTAFNELEEAWKTLAGVKDPDQVTYMYIMDAYGKSLNYQSSGGLGGAPVVFSAGPDGIYHTEDDIRSGRN